MPEPHWFCQNTKLLPSRHITLHRLIDLAAHPQVYQAGLKQSESNFLQLLADSGWAADQGCHCKSFHQKLISKSIYSRAGCSAPRLYRQHELGGRL